MDIAPTVKMADRAKPAILYLMCFFAQIIIVTASFANERIVDRIEFEAKSGDIFCLEYGRVDEPSHEIYRLLINFEHPESSSIEERVSKLDRKSAIWRRYDSPWHNLGFCVAWSEDRWRLINLQTLDAFSKFDNVSRCSAMINEPEVQVSVISLLRSMMDDPSPSNFNVDERRFEISEGALSNGRGSGGSVGGDSSEACLPPGYQGKDDRKDGNKDSGDRSYRAIVLIKEIASVGNDTPEALEHRHFVSGLIFIIGAVAAIAIGMLCSRK